MELVVKEDIFFVVEGGSRPWGIQVKGEGYFWYLVKSEDECGLELGSMHSQRPLLFLQVIVLPKLPLMRPPSLNLKLEPIFPHLERCSKNAFSFVLPKGASFALCHFPCQLASSLPHKLHLSSTKGVWGPRGTPYNKILSNSQNDQNTLGFLKCK